MKMQLVKWKRNVQEYTLTVEFQPNWLERRLGYNVHKKEYMGECTDWWLIKHTVDNQIYFEKCDEKTSEKLSNMWLWIDRSEPIYYKGSYV